MSPLVPWHYLTYHKDCHFDVGPLLEMGWRPRYSNAEMLHESYDWYCANHDLRINGGQEASPHRSPPRHGLLQPVKKAIETVCKSALSGSCRPMRTAQKPNPPKKVGRHPRKKHDEL